MIHVRFLILFMGLHYVKYFQIRSFFWSVLSCIRTEYGKIRRIFPYSVQTRENTDHKKIRIWRLFTAFTPPASQVLLTEWIEAILVSSTINGLSSLSLSSSRIFPNNHAVDIVLNFHLFLMNSFLKVGLSPSK